MNPDEMPDEPQPPSPTLWPIGFAIGIAVLLVGLIIAPLWISTIGGAIALVFGFLWARQATAELPRPAGGVEPEQREPGAAGDSALPEETSAERFPRSKFLEGTTIGLGAVIGGSVTLPVAGFAVLPPFLGQKGHEVDLGPVTDFADGQWYIATFMIDPSEGEVVAPHRVRPQQRHSRHGKAVPSFTIISNRCAHLGCPVQANGPSGTILGLKSMTVHGHNGKVTLLPVVPAGFGCPCHGGQYDTEGNRTAGPPVRALDRYSFAIDNGRLVLLSTYSVSHVDGTGAQAQIHKYKLARPRASTSTASSRSSTRSNPPHH